MIELADPLPQLLESFTTPVIAVDASGAVVGSNAMAQRLFELRGSELRERRLSSLCSLSESSQQFETSAWCTSASGIRFVAKITSLVTQAPIGQLSFLLFRDVQGAPRIGPKFEESLLRIARDPEFVSGDLEAAADLLTGVAGRSLQVERTSVWILSVDGAYLDCLSLFEESNGHHSRGARLSAKDYPIYFRALEEGRAIAADDVSTDPRTREFEGEYLTGNGIRSMLDAVIRVSGELVGVVCHEHVGSSRKWLPDEVSFAGEVADQAAHAYLIARNVQSHAERDRLASELQQAQKLEAVGRLAGGVAHDFNNLLSVVLGYAELGMASSSPLDATYLEEIHSAGTRAAELTSQLLSVGRKQVLKTSPIDVNELIQGIVSLLRSVIPESIEVELELHDAPAIVDADKGQIEQVLTNLCLNARDAIEGEGRVSIRTRIEARSPGEQQVLLVVEDDGVGMERDVLEHVFDPFFTTKKEGRGTGLGLSMVHGIAGQHGGSVTVKSRPGHGSRFEVRLPRDRSAPPALVDFFAAEAEQRERSGGRILVAEDNEAIRTLVQSLLVQAGYEVTVAVDGVEVVEAHANSKYSFDLVVLDVIMPRRNGPLALEILRRRDPDLPALFTTGYGAEALSADLLGQDGVDVIHKPFKTSDLLGVVRSCLRQQGCR